MTRRTRSILGCCLIAAAMWLPGCAAMTGSIPPTYTTEELAMTCMRNGGVWRAFVSPDGYCEYQSPGFL
jgi:hypothetical protein